MKHFLLVDDDFDDAELFKEALEEIDASARFRHIPDGNEAVEFLSRVKTELPDVIFLDINMPSCNGLECITRFKRTESIRDIPIIMYTTSSVQKEKKVALDLGAAGFISKPSDYFLLKQMLHSVIKSSKNDLLKVLQSFNGSR